MDRARIEVDPDKLDVFIRAFWRRVNAYKNLYDKELPEKMPVEFRANMETALLVFDKSALAQHDDPVKPLTADEKSQLAELYNSTSVSVSELIDAVESALIEKNK